MRSNLTGFTLQRFSSTKQLLAYFGMSFAFSWLIWFPLYAHVFGIYHLPVLPLQHAIGGLGPLLASVVTTALFAGRNGLKNLLYRCVMWGSGPHFFVALCAPFALLLIAVVMDHFIAGTPLRVQHLLHSGEFPQWSVPVFFLYNFFFFGFGEEAGWRGFALPLLQKKTSALWASILLSAGWALWHLPLFFYRSGYTDLGAGGIAGWFFSLLTGSILLTWLYNSSRGSILVCAVLHTTIDVAFTADLSGTDAVSYLGMLVTFWGIAVLLIFKPASLSLLPKITASNRE